MKTCDEMVTSLLERRERYKIEQRRKRRMMAAGAAACCVVLLFAAGIYQGASKVPEAGQTAVPEPTNVFVWNRVEPEELQRLAVCFRETTRELWLEQYPIQIAEREHTDFFLGYEIGKENGQPTDRITLGNIRGQDAEGHTWSLYADSDGGDPRMKQDDLVAYFCELPQQTELSEIGSYEVFLGESQSTGALYAVYRQNGVTVRMEYQGTREAFSALLREQLEQTW